MRRILDNPERLIDLMREVAATEILPRFQSLDAADISEKRPGDLVTVADRAAEAAFARILPALLPGSRLLGEEGFEADPSTLTALAGDAPVWIVDPVDGTHNFANGRPPFTVIVALAHKGRTLAGWIVDPIADEAVLAIAGEGARFAPAASGFAPIRMPNPPKGIAEARMTAGERLRTRMQRAAEEIPGARLPRFVARYRCVGREYMDIATGRLDLARYGGRLKPWDHAAGSLIVREQGGRADTVAAELPYQPAPEISSQAIGVSVTPELWPDFHTLVERADGLAHAG